MWEQFLHIEGAFFCTLFSSHCTSALFTGSLEEAGPTEISELIRSIRFQLGPDDRIGKIGHFGMEISRTVLSCVAQLNRHPVLRKRPSSSQGSPRYLHRLPTLLVCAMTVDAARSCLENMAFVLVAWARTSANASIALTLMEAASERLRQVSPKSSSPSASTITQVAADYIDEMIDTAQLWQVYYRVYRPISSVRLEQPTTSIRPDNAIPRQTEPVSEGGDATASSSSNNKTAMDYLASAADAAHSSQAPSRGVASDSTPPAHAAAPVTSTLAAIQPANAEALLWNVQGFNAPLPLPMSAVSPPAGQFNRRDANPYDPGLPFDLEAFLRDVDQLF